MMLELSFKKVCKMVKEQGKEDPKLIEAIDHLLGMTIICSSAALGPAGIALLPLLKVKNELIKTGKYVFDKLTKPKAKDYLQRQKTMAAAYGLLVFTSFFDALDEQLPDELRKEIDLLDKEKALLAKKAQAAIGSGKCDPEGGDAYNERIISYTFPFPHPTQTLHEQCKLQLQLWGLMAQGFLNFVKKLAFYEKADSVKKKVLQAGIEGIEFKASERFEAQYLELARKYEDFAIWANLQSHKGTQIVLNKMSDYVKQHAELSAASAKSIDVGFERLHRTILSIPEVLHVEQATEIVESLNKYYTARLKDPIIEDKDVGDEGGSRISFPTVSEAFVPQAFKIRYHTDKSQSLEDESYFEELTKRNDLGAFLLSYLSSPYSTEAPMLILGHPGSGKSLLTTILSAQLMSDQFTAIRVPLREVNADADIRTQIEEYIGKVTGVSIDSWHKLSKQFKNNPPIVILDGYDELLQTSGAVFRSYIMDAQRFQESEADQGRFLRLIITSRVTLIDKAAIPHGSTILRLLEFGHHQRECWMNIWNKANAAYFGMSVSTNLLYLAPRKKERKEY